MEAIQSNSNQLSGLKKQLGKDVVIASLMIMIDSVVRFFSVGKTMDSGQLHETARLILQEFYLLKIEDLNIFFERFKSGFYGQTFDRIDGNVIMVKLREYVDERMEVAERLSLEKHKEIIETEKQEQYLIKVGENWVRSCGDDFEEVDRKELATAYTYGVACKLKSWLIKEYYSTTPDKVKVCDKNKADGSFFDHLEKNAPQLLPKGEAYKRATTEYFEMKQKILSDESLNGFEKENAIRALANLAPISIEEYNERNLVTGK